MSGLIELGYIGFEVSDFGAWERFTGDVLGLESVDGPVADTRLVRLDDQAYRIILTKGPSDDVGFVGWRTLSIDAFATHLDSVGLPYSFANEEDCALRRVDRLLCFQDNNGLRHEAFEVIAPTDHAFVSNKIISGYVTGNGGLGHVVFGSNDYAGSVAFAQKVLGMKMSDTIAQRVGSIDLEVSFLHLNERHHSIAFSNHAGVKRLHHFLLEVGLIDDVGRTRDRHLAAGFKIAQDIGQHPNDRMISYYGMTPSGFLIEFGYGGIKIDESDWETSHFQHLSEWGHRPPA